MKKKWGSYQIFGWMKMGGSKKKEKCFVITGKELLSNISSTIL